MLWRLTLRSLWHRRATLVLVVLAIALSTALLTGVERVRQETRDRFTSTVSGVDLIVGKPSGALNLLLYSVFRLGEPVANMDWESVEAITKRPEVAWVVPISLGDNLRGFPVVGTTTDYFRYYRYGRDEPLRFSDGEPFDDVFDTVLGVGVAARLGLKVGDEVVLGHGTGTVSVRRHDTMPFKVRGVLAATGTPVDQSVHISLAAMTAIHLDWVAGTPLPGRHTSPDQARSRDLQPDSVTSLLVGLNSRVAVFQMQRWINTRAPEPLQAVIPGVALGQMWRMLGMVEQALRVISVAVLGVALLVMLSALLTALNERRREMAILRALGARPWQIGLLMVGESALLSLVGVAAGVLFLQGVAALAMPVLSERLGMALSLWRPAPLEALWLLVVLVSGTLVGLIPAWRAYRHTLSDGLTPRY
ncbi:ABC transporter permease [Alloalcanivorax xenomutans]|uniref:ABC transporter permease n=1 Tax=Alloalcanivorax xenomutans TaxID=1094342 RepID=UPI003BACE91E